MRQTFVLILLFLLIMIFVVVLASCTRNDRHHADVKDIEDPRKQLQITKEPPPTGNQIDTNDLITLCMSTSTISEKKNVQVTGIDATTALVLEPKGRFECRVSGNKILHREQGGTNNEWKQTHTWSREGGSFVIVATDPDNS